MSDGDSKKRSDGDELTYSAYINVPALLRAQRLPEAIPRGRTRDEWPVRPDVTGDDGTKRPWREGDPWPAEWPHDELLFIVTHQTFELWFKQLLHDLDDVMARALAIVGAHGATLLPADLAARDPADAPPLRRSLARFPETRGVIEHDLASSAWASAWARELHEPAYFPRRRGASISLAWFDDATLALFGRRVQRAAAILKHATGAFDVLGTMPPEEFLAFRSRLDPASGFGSTQFREIEMLLGLKDAHAKRLQGPGELSFVRHMPADEVTRMRARLAAPSLRDLVYALLAAPDVRSDDAAADTLFARNLRLLHDDVERARSRGGAMGEAEAFLHAQWRGVDEILAHAENVTLAHEYLTPRTRPEFRAFLERCLDLDDALRLWRQAHIPMVERMIGARPGTGGGGVAYLATTLRNTRAFPCLWEFRSVLARG